MARIRSIHPGLFTDEAFVSLSMAARVFLIGIWVDADDHGVFEWKPLTLKMRVFPAEDINVAPLLDELAAANMVRKFTHEGREYGACRNFGKYQHPKKPIYRHPVPNEIRTYLAIKGAGTEPVPHQFPTSTEPVPQGIGVGIGEGIGIDDDGDARASADDPPVEEPKREPLISSEAFALADAVIEACGLDPENPPPEWCGLPYRLQSGLASGWSGDLDVLPTVKRIMQNRTGPPTSPKYFEKAIADAHASRLAPVPIGKPETPRGNAKPNLVAIALGVGADAAARSRVGRGPHSDAGRLLPKRESG